MPAFVPVVVAAVAGLYASAFAVGWGLSALSDWLAQRRAQRRER